MSNEILHQQATQVISEAVLQSFGLNSLQRVEAFGNGLINNTWKLTSGDEQYILQRVNSAVFSEPEHIAFNVRMISNYLQQHNPDYLFVSPITASNGTDLVSVEGNGYFRLFPFVPGSHSIDVVETPEQAFEAAAQFGRFTRMLSGIEISKLKITIPGFHDLSLRYTQFQTALQEGNMDRIRKSQDWIEFLQQQSFIVTTFQQIVNHPEFRLRVTHHDTKISNVLFNSEGKGVCVIDLDTVMPGYFISDVGDMMRTFLSPVSEEESEYNKIVVRDDFYKAIAQGYFREMESDLSTEEKKYFFYAGTFMIYMQALRFLTDYLNNDRYYGAKYPEQNFVRAGNQVTLLQRLLEKETLYTDPAFLDI